MKRFAYVCLLILISGSGANPAPRHDHLIGTAQAGGWIRRVGWAKIRGELMLYPTRSDYAKNTPEPRCISGVFPADDGPDLLKYESRKVEISGVLVRYETLPSEDRPALPRKVLAGSVISNFCLGDKVMLLKHIRMVQGASARGSLRPRSKEAESRP